MEYEGKESGHRGVSARRVVELLWCENEELGEWGYLPRNAPGNFTPISPTLAFHDIVEHDIASPDYGDYHNECHAFGAIMWIRGQGGFNRLRGFNSVYFEEGFPVTLAGELCRFAFDALEREGEHCLAKLPAAEPGTPADKGWLWALLASQAAVKYAREYTIEDDFIAWIQGKAETITRWIYQGWLDTASRFRHTTPEEVCGAFITLGRKMHFAASFLDDDRAYGIRVAWDDQKLSHNITYLAHCHSCGGGYQTDDPDMLGECGGCLEALTEDEDDEG